MTEGVVAVRDKYAELLRAVARALTSCSVSLQAQRRKEKFHG